MVEWKDLLRISGLAALVVLAGGCRGWRGSCNDPVPYQSAKAVAPLVIPPSLQQPDTTNALRIPELKAVAAPPRAKKDGCLDEPPPFATPKPAQAPAA